MVGENGFGPISQPLFLARNPLRSQEWLAIPGVRRTANLAKSHLSLFANHQLAPTSSGWPLKGRQSGNLAVLPTLFSLPASGGAPERVGKVQFGPSSQPLFPT